ncbi:hypothetical protein BT96DRAFT_974422 [Gymnopus androsaceus JB14]|uniref:Uncharacterized protein n=1 Tax=Gymnopus androsaceus JB14 TaxID=1447944 RepID=A0A6A4HWE4_9AGAR|nr:hypothetical protein BT96DRAFT_974422 [Gymnopus androsaceus JB14]
MPSSSKFAFSTADLTILQKRAARASDPLAPCASSILKIIGSSKASHDCTKPLISTVFKFGVQKIKKNIQLDREYIETEMIQWKGDEAELVLQVESHMISLIENPKALRLTGAFSLHVKRTIRALPLKAYLALSKVEY